MFTLDRCLCAATHARLPASRSAVIAAETERREQDPPVTDPLAALEATLHRQAAVTSSDAFVIVVDIS